MPVEKLGEVRGESAMLCMILADATFASELPDHDGTEVSMEAVYTAVRALGTQNRGMIVDAGGSHVADVWSIDGGFAVTSFHPGDGENRDADAVGNLVETLDTVEAEGQGQVEVTSGTLAIMLEYQPGREISPTLLAQEGVRELPNGLLIPCPNGTYEVYRDELEHKSDLGTLEARVRIIRRA